jgi:hypothetical protein
MSLSQETRRRPAGRPATVPPATSNSRLLREGAPPSQQDGNPRPSLSSHCPQSKYQDGDFLKSDIRVIVLGSDRRGTARSRQDEQARRVAKISAAEFLRAQAFETPRWRLKKIWRNLSREKIIV